MSEEIDKFGFTKDMVLALSIGMEIKIPKDKKSLKFSFKEYTLAHRNYLKIYTLGKTLKIGLINYNSSYNRYFIRFKQDNSFGAVVAKDIYNLLFEEPIKIEKIKPKKKDNYKLFGI